MLRKENKDIKKERKKEKKKSTNEQTTKSVIKQVLNTSLVYPVIQEDPCSNHGASM